MRHGPGGDQRPGFPCDSRQRPLKRPTHLSRDLYECALAIILDSWKITAPIRMLSITGANLVGDGEDTIQEQLSLFDRRENERQRKGRKTWKPLWTKSGKNLEGRLFRLAR